MFKRNYFLTHQSVFKLATYARRLHFDSISRSCSCASGNPVIYKTGFDTGSVCSKENYFLIHQSVFELAVYARSSWWTLIIWSDLEIASRVHYNGTGTFHSVFHRFVYTRIYVSDLMIAVTVCPLSEVLNKKRSTRLIRTRSQPPPSAHRLQSCWRQSETPRRRPTPSLTLFLLISSTRCSPRG